MQRFLCKHLLNLFHFLSAVSATDSDVSYAVHLDASDVSFSGLQHHRNSGNNTAVFKVPEPPTRKRNVKSRATQKPAKKKPKFVCSYCLKGYVCSKSFKTHVRTHILEGKLNSTIPVKWQTFKGTC